MVHLAKLSASLTLMVALLLSPAIQAAELAIPTGKVLLTIKGAMENPNVGNEVQLDLATLESLPATQFTTNTPWSDEPQHFKGVRLNVLFEAIGAAPKSFVAVGLDDYKFTVTDIDFERYPVIVAYQHNGAPISVRQLGPLRIMMPFDDYPELLTPRNESSSVWQLLELELL